MAIEKVSALVLDRLAVFEFGVICEVFGIDRSAEGVPELRLQGVRARAGQADPDLGGRIADP